METPAEAWWGGRIQLTINEAFSTVKSHRNSTRQRATGYRGSLKTRSEVWCSGTSRTSSTGTAAVRARARAEASKARLSYVEEEANPRQQHVEEEANLRRQRKLQQAKLEASLEMLEHQKEVAVAIAEAEVLEAAVDRKSERYSCDLNRDSVPLEISRRTEQYVLEQLKERDSEFQSCDNTDTRAKTGPVPRLTCHLLH